MRPAKRSIAMRARPDGLLAAAPLILRFAPDRRRQSGDVQPGAAPGCRTGLFVCRRFELLVSGLVARVCRIIFLSLSAPGRIRTADHLVRSQVLYPAELRAPARSLALMEPIVSSIEQTLPCWSPTANGSGQHSTAFSRGQVPVQAGRCDLASGHRTRNRSQIPTS